MEAFSHYDVHDGPVTEACMTCTVCGPDDEDELEGVAYSLDLDEACAACMEVLVERQAEADAGLWYQMDFERGVFVPSPALKAAGEVEEPF